MIEKKIPKWIKSKSSNNVCGRGRAWWCTQYFFCVLGWYWIKVCMNEMQFCGRDLKESGDAKIFGMEFFSMIF